MAAKSGWLGRAPGVLGGLLTAAFIAAPVDAAGTVAFANGRSIDADAFSATAVVAADIDSDGDLDVLVAKLVSYDERTVIWYENTDGEGTFSEGVAISDDRESAAG